MISAALLVLAGLSAPASTAHTAYTSGTAQKGHAPIPAPRAMPRLKGATIACNPDPLKGRACRHHQVKAEEARSKALARADRDRAARP